MRERVQVANPAVAYGVLPLAGAALIAVSAQLSIPLQPVPITLQVLAVVLLGYTVGPRIAGLALSEYLIAGFAGLPVFAAGIAGPIMFQRPSTGYLFGFLLAAPLIGLVAGSALERGRLGAASWLRAGLAGVLGLVVIYVAGGLWLGFWLAAHGFPSGLAAVWQAGVAPFLLIDAAKVALAAVTARAIHRGNA